MRLFYAIFIFILCLRSFPAFSLDVVAIYRGSCQVDFGVIIGVDKKRIALATFSGKVVEIDKYQVVGLAKYPVPYLPAPGLDVGGAGTKFYRFYTLKEGRLAELATGWPFEFNSETIQVLTVKGDDFLVRRDDIWELEQVEPPKHVNFGRRRPPIDLRPPLAFEKCWKSKSKGVLPHTTIGDAIGVKRYFDHLSEGYELVDDYNDRQDFYSVPQYYRNRTQLGTWGLYNSRYTNVGARRINFLPFVQDEYSGGPFGFQRIIRSGVYPISWSVHAEPSLSVYYGLKADYVVLDVFYDPQALLIGERYDWSKGHLNSLDDRLVEKGGLKFGIAFKYLQLGYAFAGGKHGIRAGEEFLDMSFSSGRVFTKFMYRLYTAELQAGSDGSGTDHQGTQDEGGRDYSYSMSVVRINLEAPIGKKFSGRLSLLQRRLDDGNSVDHSFRYDSVYRTVSFFANWRLDYRWTAVLLTIQEFQEAEATFKNTGDDSVSRSYTKAGAGVMVAF